jgi:hypothetical protein
VAGSSFRQQATTSGPLPEADRETGYESNQSALLRVKKLPIVQYSMHNAARPICLETSVDRGCQYADQASVRRWHGLLM